MRILAQMFGKNRKILRPLSRIYAGITGLRNVLFDKKILRSTGFDIPLIVVGNLRVGGTGKSPMILYLVQLLHDRYKIAVLSRGYKRKTKGFVIAKKGMNHLEIGDEALQLYRRFPDITVAVDANRVQGIRQLLNLENSPDVVLLDDAFQHRKVVAGFNILLTAYDDLYVDDSVLPAGNLREKVSGAERAQVIVVTKCPENITETAAFDIAVKLKAGLQQTVFFTSIRYDDKVRNAMDTLPLTALKNYKVLLLSGIANPKPLERFLQKQEIEFHSLRFADHHHYSQKDLAAIQKAYRAIKAEKKIILTTEKDYVRIFGGLNNLYYLSIETRFINHQKDFDSLILNYVEQSTRDRSVSKR